MSYTCCGGGGCASCWGWTVRQAQQPPDAGRLMLQCVCVLNAYLCIRVCLFYVCDIGVDPLILYLNPLMYRCICFTCLYSCRCIWWVGLAALRGYSVGVVSFWFLVSVEKYCNEIYTFIYFFCFLSVFCCIISTYLTISTLF